MLDQISSLINGRLQKRLRPSSTGGSVASWTWTWRCGRRKLKRRLLSELKLAVQQSGTAWLGRLRSV